LYLHNKGKGNLVTENVVVHSLLGQGFRICAVDLRGQGETQPAQEGKFWDFLAGKPIFGQRVADVLAILSWLLQPQMGANGVYIWAQGVSALYACHAAALDDNVQGLVLEEPLLSFESVVRVKVPAYRHEVILPAVLEKYDLPQVYQALCPRPVTLVNPLRGDRSRAVHHEVEQAYRLVAETYQAQETSTKWKTLPGISRTERCELLLSCFMKMAQGIRKERP
jgi:pimeloyl-ACP methyl ester carboxylesterase